MFEDGLYNVSLYSGGKSVDDFVSEVISEGRGSTAESWPTKQLIIWQNCVSLYDKTNNTRRILHGTFSMTKIGS